MALARDVIRGSAGPQRGVWHAVRWVRVGLYALVLSATALNVLGGMVARQALLNNLAKRSSARTPPSGAAVPVSKSGDDGGSSGRRKTGPHSLQTPYPCSELRPPAHVVYAADAAEYNAMLTSANSALHNSKHPERLRFHLIYPAETGPAPLCRVVEQYTKRFPGVKCVRPHGTTLSYSCKAGQSDAHGACHCATAQFRLVPFAASRYEVLEHTKANWLDRKELLMGVNFARNFLDDLLLPAGVERAVYMDVDTVVQGDAVKLFETPLQPGRYFAAVSNCYLHMSYWFDFDVPVVKRTFHPRDCYINAGVYVVDLVQYKEDRVQERIGALIRQHQKSKIWKQGVHQSSFVLALGNHTQLLDARWNVLQLGWNKALPPERLKAAWVLHWNGEKKPWLRDGLYAERWRPYTDLHAA